MLSPVEDYGNTTAIQGSHQEWSWSLTSLLCAVNNCFQSLSLEAAQILWPRFTFMTSLLLAVSLILAHLLTSDLDSRCLSLAT